MTPRRKVLVIMGVAAVVATVAALAGWRYLADWAAGIVVGAYAGHLSYTGWSRR